MSETEQTPPTPAKAAPAKKPKPPALEDKPFQEFIQEHFAPALKTALGDRGVTDLDLRFGQEKLAIAGMENEVCWQIKGSWRQGQRQFNLYFLNEDIQGPKGFSCATHGTAPSLLESFMIDERKVTLDLMVSYTLQRLNGQKWLDRN